MSTHCGLTVSKEKLLNVIQKTKKSTKQKTQEEKGQGKGIDSRNIKAKEPVVVEVVVSFT